MQTPETLKVNNDSLYEWLDLPSEWFSFWVDTPDWDPEKDKKSKEGKINFVKNLLESSAFTESEKELILSMIEWVEDMKIIDSIYYIFKKHEEDNSLNTPEKVHELIYEILSETRENKIKYIKDLLLTAVVSEWEKEIILSLIEWIEDSLTIDNIYNIVKKYVEKNQLSQSEKVNEMIQEITLKTTEYVISEPKKLHEFMENLHLPLDKKDILISIILSTALPTLWLPWPVDPLAVNSFYNSATMINELDKRVKSDTKYVRDVAAKISKKIFDRMF